MKIAVIPARGGSKRIPKKNIKNFCGQPIISLAIKAAQETKLFDKIIVSTDSKRIAKIAIKYKAEVPFLRPKKLSDDKTGTAEVMAHAIKWLKKNNHNPSAVCCIYPTSVLIFPEDIKKAYKKFKSGKWNYVFSATSFVTQIQKAFQKKKNEGLKMFFPKMDNKRSQELEVAYHDAALFYWGKPESWIRLKKIYSKHSTIKYVPRWRVCDIDTHEDWKQAEIIYKSLVKK